MVFSWNCIVVYFFRLESFISNILLSDEFILLFSFDLFIVILLCLNESFIFDHFYGTTQNKLLCLKCKSETYRYQLYNINLYE